MSFICHIHNYTESNQQWNVFSAFNPYKCTHTWSSGEQSGGFGGLLKGLISVVDNSCRSRDSNPQPRDTSPTLYPLGHDCPLVVIVCVLFQVFCDELESLIHDQMKKGKNPASLLALQQIADFMTTSVPTMYPAGPQGGMAALNMSECGTALRYCVRFI